MVRHLLAHHLPEREVEIEELPPKIWAASSLRQRQVSLTFYSIPRTEVPHFPCTYWRNCSKLVLFPVSPKGKKNKISLYASVFVLCVPYFIFRMPTFSHWIQTLMLTMNDYIFHLNVFPQAQALMQSILFASDSVAMYIKMKYSACVDETALLEPAEPHQLTPQEILVHSCFSTPGQPGCCFWANRIYDHFK